MKKPRLPSTPQTLLPMHDPNLIDPAMASTEEWYTTEDVMKHLNMSRSSVYRLRVKKQLPAYKLGNVIVYPKSLINKILLHKALQNLHPKPL